MQGDEYGKIYRLGELSSNGNRRILTLGREDASTFNVIPIKESTTTYISRRHCTIELDDKNEKYYLRDGQWDKEAKDNWVNSLNGTFINSDEVSMEGREIYPGDIISVGDVKLRVEGY
ncbi:MAG: FHA domain-containing protein [Muribaculaceae bacterium]|nr:FHA domain-containing protein [Muribaculaceae bacterium]